MLDHMNRSIDVLKGNLSKVQTGSASPSMTEDLVVYYKYDCAYYAPMAGRCEGEDIVLTLTVTDACGASASDSMVVHVRKGNSPLTVKADP